VGDVRYRRLFEESIEGLVVTDLDGTIHAANRAFAQLVGDDAPEALVGTTTLGLWVDPAARVRAREAHADGSDAAVDTWWRTRRGELLCVSIRARLLDEGPDGRRYLSHVRDVTLERRQEAAWRALSVESVRLQGDALLTHLTRRLHDIVDARMAFVGTLSDTAPQTLRYDVAIEHGVRVERAAARVERACPWLSARGAILVCHPSEPDGEPRCVVAPIRRAGAVVGAVGVVMHTPPRRVDNLAPIVDVFAQRIGADLERRHAEDRFGALFDLAPDAIVICDARGRVVQSNAAAEALLGYAASELACLGIEDLVPSEHRARHVEQRSAFAEGARSRLMGGARRRLNALRKDGSTVPVEITLSRVEVGGERCVIAAIRDVRDRVRAESERERLEEEVRHAQRHESLGRMAGGIAHNFNNLLAISMANIELARAALPREHVVCESLDAITIATTRGRDLVRQILAYSRRQPNRRTPTSIADLVSEVTRLVRATIPSGIAIASSVEPLPLVLLDADQIHQVLTNLVTNAWQAIERPTGSIAIEARRTVVDVDDGTTDAPPGEYVQIDVRDDGCGMDAATIARVFEPFFTTRGVGGGTGLGLAVSQGMVAGHGGVIRVQSALGKGTTFSVLIPLRQGVAGDCVGKRPTTAVSAAVLVIDDEPYVARGTKKLLELLGCEAHAFTDAAEAVDALARGLVRADVVMTDLHMPRVDGLELAAQVAAVRSDLPILLVSGNHSLGGGGPQPPNVRVRLEKPFGASDLRAALLQALGRPESAGRE
jgi:PAS domain S-box-containing protein